MNGPTNQQRIPLIAMTCTRRSCTCSGSIMKSSRSVMLAPQILLLMPLYAALVGGDLVAKEAEDGTLRMILSRPISRFRLLFVKWLAGVVFSIVLVTVLGAMALAFARIWFPWRGMFV